MHEIELEDVLRKISGLESTNHKRSLRRQHGPALQAGPVPGGDVSEGRSRRVLLFDGSTADVQI